MRSWKDEWINDCINGWVSMNGWMDELCLKEPLTYRISARAEISCEYMANFGPGAMLKTGQETFVESVLHSHSSGAHVIANFFLRRVFRKPS